MKYEKICPFCEENLTTEESIFEIYIRCNNCILTNMTTRGKKVNYYRYNLSFDQNSELNGYDITLKENDLFYNVGATNNFIKNTSVHQTSSLVPMYKCLARINEWFKLDLNDPIHSAKNILKKLVSLAIFL